jgi:hypothetical protein
VIDNGLLYVYETGRKRGQMFDTSGGKETLVASDDARSASLMPRYRSLDETFQKWAVWRHLARASRQLDEPRTGIPHGGQRNAAASD